MAQHCVQVVVMLLWSHILHISVQFVIILTAKPAELTCVGESR